MDLNKETAEVDRLLFWARCGWLSAVLLLAACFFLLIVSLTAGEPRFTLQLGTIFGIASTFLFLVPCNRIMGRVEAKQRAIEEEIRSRGG